MAIDDNTDDNSFANLPRSAEGIPILTIPSSKTETNVPTGPKLAQNDVTSLYNFAKGNNPKTETETETDVTNLYNHFSGNADTSATPPVTPTAPPTVQDVAASNRESFVRGISDVLDTAAHGLGNVADVVTKPFPSVNAKVQAENDEMQAADAAKRQQYETTNPNAVSGSDPSRTLGQIVSTLPLAPAKAVQLWKGAVGAMPSVVAGVKTAAPIINRAVGAVGEGAIGGATYGAATAGSNDQSTLANVGQGLITGAIAGPIIHGAGELGANAVPGIKALWANVNANKVAQNSGLDVNVIKNVFDRLSDAGYSPTEAQAELTRLGPKATLMDLDTSLTSEGSALAAHGGSATSILKNRMETRAAGANNEIVNIMNTKLGPKPDIESVGDAIHDLAQKETKSDYKAAHTSGATLDISDLDDKLKNQIDKAVGPKQQAAKIMRSYLYKTELDNKGNEISVLRHTVPELHEVRQAIDDVIEKRGTVETSAGKNAMRVLNDTRAAVDSELKSVDAMKAADQKFAYFMKAKEGLKNGYEAISKPTTREDFNRMWNNAEPETKRTIRIGMRAAISDYMDKAARGELEGAKQLIGKKSLNRANLRTAFGVRADEALDALEKEAAFKNTENKVTQGSQTAERQAILNRYGGKTSEGNNLADILRAVGIDATAGLPGLTTATVVAKKTGNRVIQNVAGNKLENLISGTADVLSQSGIGIQKTLDTVAKLGKVQKSIAPRAKSPYKLPITSVAPIGQFAYGQRKRLGQ